eukprot:TRINITY_DN11077_c0_g1_i7.p1 TRINITY_DN11077_c0_g1~~TRINITY_DN11077_c0_g1_i7.p1  ORF type:complete len:600 (+),score=116.89 TRINITY_DN11077_c0_g1_i7:63-1862(+)
MYCIVFTLVFLQLWQAHAGRVNFAHQFSDLKPGSRADEGPWSGRISGLSSEQLRNLMAKDMELLLQFHKDLVLLENIRHRMPDFFEKKFETRDRVGEAVVEGAFEFSESVIGAAHMVKAVKAMWNLYESYTDLEDYYDVVTGITEGFVAKVSLLVMESDEVTLDYAGDVTMGHLHQAFRSAQKAVRNLYYANSQDWYKFKGTKPVPIWNNLKNMEQVGVIEKEEDFILEKERVRGFHGHSRREDAEDEEKISPFDEGFSEMVEAAPVIPPPDLGERLYARLGDGRGWVDTKFPDKWGGLGLVNKPYMSNKFSNEERKGLCTFLQSKLSNVSAPDDKTLEKIRSGVSGVQKVSHHWGWTLGEAILGVGAVGLAVVFPPSAIVLGIATPIMTVTSTTIRYGSQVAFEKMLQPLLEYSLLSLVNYEFALMNPDIKPKSKVCDYDPTWMDQFKKAVGEVERIPCDILTNKCAGEDMFCMRQGVFTRTSGQYSTKGWCVKAHWPLFENSFPCLQDEECKSGLCWVGHGHLPEDSHTGVSDGFFQALDWNKWNKDMRKPVQRLLGVCVEPCDLKTQASEGCDRFDVQSSFGYLPSSDKQPEGVSE